MRQFCSLRYATCTLPPPNISKAPTSSPTATHEDAAAERENYCEVGLWTMMRILSLQLCALADKETEKALTEA